jgi:RHS repeat-associated protein
MLQSTHFDLVIGLDVHIVNVPTPAGVPIPTPVPMSFVGVVFDPMGLVVGAAISLVTSGSPGAVFVNQCPVTNCGTSATNALTMPHLPVPGVTFAKNMMPVLEGDADLFFGSDGVSFGGSYGVRALDLAFSCSDPRPLPSSIVVPIPKGLPVLNRPLSVIDLGALATQAALRGLMALGRYLGRGAYVWYRLFRLLRRRSAFFQRLSRALGGCHFPAGASRARTMLARFARFVTGHPIDLVTGNLFTDVIDVALPGPLPLTFERVYESARSARAGVLGHGWSHPLDEALFFERGRAVYRAGDGRELEFALFDLPERTLRVGDVVEHVPDRLVLRRVASDRYEVEHDDGTVHELAYVTAEPVARLVRIRSEDRHHAIELSYDARGRLESVRDSGGRLLRFEHDTLGRLTRLQLPVPHGRGWYSHRHYEYDAAGDLVRVIDAAGESYRYAYRNHLLVQETDRTGQSFYFQYDGAGQSARCVRTWGDGGIYDHLVDFDVRNRRSFVRDSVGASKTCAWDARGLVTRLVDGEGRTTTFEHDAASLLETVVVSADGTRVEKRYDARGNLVATKDPLGAATITYEGRRPVRLVDDRGRAWSWRYDAEGHLVEAIEPGGVRAVLSWEGGLVTEIEETGRERVRLAYDEQREIAASIGRVYEAALATGAVVRTERDAEGRPIAAVSLAGVTSRARYDAEGHLVEYEDATRHQRFAYGPGHRLARREEGGVTLRFEHDTECRLVAVLNEAGERYAFALDRVGEVREETGFDGASRRFVRDRRGHVTMVLRADARATQQEHDALGRLTRVTHPDGAFVAFTYDGDGDLAAVENESCRVELTRDEAGRVIRERSVHRDGAHHVESTYANDRRVELRTSLGARLAFLHATGVGAGQRRASEVFFGHDPVPAVTIERDLFGVERARRFANGVDLVWDRDEAGRPRARRSFARFTGLDGIAAAAAVLAGPSLGTPAPKRELTACSYAWRGDDQIAALDDSAHGASRFDHDARGRLVRETRDGRVRERVLDAVGNLYRSVDHGDRRYARGGRLELRDGARLEHDAEGNLVRKVEPDGAEWRFVWNGHGLLREVLAPDARRVQLEYDPFARRTRKRVLAPDGSVERDVRFVWDGDTLVHEVEGGAVTTWHRSPEGVLLARERDGQLAFVTTDHLGTPTELYDERANLIWQMRLDTWGAPEFLAGTATECPWRWPGQYEDPETGLYYNRHRYYSPADGRYISQDPIRLAGGLALYGYVDDPLSEIDPLGLNARALAANLVDAGRPLAHGQTPHHIVEENRSGIAEYSRALLARWNMSVDDASNGARLWGTHPSQLQSPTSHPGRLAARGAGTYHAGREIHGQAADRLIYRILREGERRGIHPRELLDDVGRRMESGAWGETFRSCRR